MSSEPVWPGETDRRMPADRQLAVLAEGDEGEVAAGEGRGDHRERWSGRAPRRATGVRGAPGRRVAGVATTPP